MLLGSLVATASAGPGATLGVGGKKAPPPWLEQKKPNKKQLEVQKHEMLAEFDLFQANDLAGAVKEYQTILRIDPDNQHAAMALASIYVRDKKPKQAIDVLAKLTRKNPKSPDAWIAFAQIQDRTGDDKGAKASLDKALGLDPYNLDANLMAFDRAYSKFKAGDAGAKPEALDAAKRLKLIARNDKYLGKMVERAIVELSGDPMELTIYDAKQAYAAAFDRGLLGDVNAAMAKAKAGFEECIKSQPRNEDCHYNLGLVYASVKASDAYDPKKAQAEFAAAPSLPLAWVESAKLYRAADDNRDARSALEKALALDKNLAVAHVELGILDKLDGKTDAAVDHFVAAIDDDPWGATGDRALIELTKVRPTHPYVAEGVLAGKSGDVFSSDKFQAVIPLLERELGGVDEGAPEKAVIEQIVQRLADGSGVRQQFKVSIVKTKEVNAMALADGRVYVTRGMFDMLKKKFPNRPIDANNDILGHVLGHELQHVLRRHTLNSALFQEAMKESRPLDPSVVTSVTRLQEIDADRQGMVMAFLAGYKPRGGIEFMEAMGQEEEIPPHLDHPTFQERVAYLTEYWTNDVRYAFVSFRLGVAEMDKGARLEQTDMKAAVAAYTEAVEHFKRYRAMLPNLKEAMNDLGIAYAKIGVLAMTAQDTPLGRWQSRFSLERDSAVKYAGLVRDEDRGTHRGIGDKARIPWQLREAIAQFKEALAVDETYSKARLNLAMAYLAANQLDNAKDALGRVEAKGGVAQGEIDLVRGIVLAETKDFAKAQASFDAAMKQPVSKRAAAYNLARSLELAGNKPEAKKAYLQYVRLYPGGAWANAAKAAAAKL
ncbi:MAG: tetratricopeptide repeat protein [Acidobacteriota bacterium]